MTAPLVDHQLDWLAAFRPNWYVYDIRQGHAVRAELTTGWIARLQHSRGGLLTTGYGTTCREALHNALVVVAEVNRLLPAATAEPALPTALDPDTFVV